MHWHIENMPGLAGLFYLSYLWAKAFDKIFPIELNYILKKIKKHNEEWL